MTIAVVYGLVALENVLANLVLIPLFSLQGAAAGASVSQALLAVPIFVLARRVAGSIDLPRTTAMPQILLPRDTRDLPLCAHRTRPGALE